MILRILTFLILSRGESGWHIFEGEYLFTFAQITDTHIGQTRMAGLVLENVTDWILEKKNVAFLVHTGDLVENSDSRAAWEDAYKGMHRLDGVCNWTTLAGNHDVIHYGQVNFSNYEKYFGLEAINRFVVVKNRLLFILLSWTTMDGRIPTKTLEWMDNVINNYSHMNTVICLHPYLYPYSLFGIKNTPLLPLTVPNAEEVWDHINKHRNVILTLSGHVHNNWVRIRVANNHEVWSICTENLANRGYVRLFDVYTDRIEVYAYSSWEKVSYDGPLDQFTINLGSNDRDYDRDLWSDSIDPMPTDLWIPNVIVISITAIGTLSAYLITRKIQKRRLNCHWWAFP